MPLTFRDIFIGYQNALQAFLASTVVTGGLFFYFIGYLDVDALSDVNLAMPLSYISSVLISIRYVKGLHPIDVRPILRTYWFINRFLLPPLAFAILYTKIFASQANVTFTIAVSALITAALAVAFVQNLISKY